MHLEKRINHENSIFNAPPYRKFFFPSGGMHDVCNQSAEREYLQGLLTEESFLQKRREILMTNRLELQKQAFTSGKRRVAMKTNVLLLILILSLLTGCTSSAQSQLKESVCKDCLEKTPFYRNGEWLS